MIIKQISIFVENRRGRLAEITGIIADSGINIRALSVADTTHFGILRIIVDNPFEAERILRENNLTASLTSVVAVNVPDSPGGLHSVLKILADSDLSVEYMYHASINTDDKTACMVMRIEEDLKAQQVLAANGYTGPSYIN
jgi:ACT domain-containing protein